MPVRSHQAQALHPKIVVTEVTMNHQAGSDAGSARRRAAVKTVLGIVGWVTAILLLVFAMRAAFA